MSLQTKMFWIFDLDGTLTVPVHDFAYLRTELGIPETADILDYLDALPPVEAARRHARLHEIEIGLAHQAIPAPGAPEALALLHQAGVQMGILTRNHKDIALLTLETIGLGQYFVAGDVLGRNEVPPKPDPAGITHLLSRWGAAPSNAVMVGDYLFDLQAGRAAGTATIQVGRPDGKIWPEFTDYLLQTLALLTNYL
jgi:HAD superfamily hydrolase (TIGR01509 family)